MTTTSRAIHHRWDDLPQDRPMAKLERKRIIGQQMMLSQVFLHQGCCVPTHAHENEQFACVVSGQLRFGIGAENSKERYQVLVSADEVLHLPSNVPHSAEAVVDTLVIDLFSPPSATTGIDVTHGT